MVQTRTVELGELLSPAQLAIVEKIISQIQQQHADAETLRIYLRTLREELVAKGVDADYLHYSILYSAGLC